MKIKWQQRITNTEVHPSVHFQKKTALFNQHDPVMVNPEVLKLMAIASSCDMIG